MTLNGKTVAVDWDGTFVDDGQYPKIGQPKENAVKVLKRIIEEGGRILIWTCRGGHEQENGIAIRLKENGIYNFIINQHFQDVVDQFEHSSPKVFADIYIDDRGIHTMGKEIDWYEVEQILFPHDKHK